MRMVRYNEAVCQNDYTKAIAKGEHCNDQNSEEQKNVNTGGSRETTIKLS